MKEEKFRLKINPGLALISLPATAPLGAFLFDIANEMIILHLISFPQFLYDLIYFIYIYQIHLFTRTYEHIIDELSASVAL